MKITKEWLESLDLNTPEQYQAMTENINAERKAAGLQPLIFETYESVQTGVSDDVKAYLAAKGQTANPYSSVPAHTPESVITPEDIQYYNNSKK